MEPLRLQAVAARVVAWHNRHPLARPITAAHVYSIGYVALPFRTARQVESATDAVSADPEDGGSLRERAMARAGHREPGAEAPAAAAAARPAAEALHGAFSEKFIAPFKPASVARWAARHGRTLAERPVQAPLREVPEDAKLATAPHAITLYVLTAAVEVGKSRTRVLVGGGNEPDILGRRLWDWPRLGALLAVAVLLVVSGALGYAWLRGHLNSAEATPAVSESASAPERAASVALPSSLPSSASLSGPVTVPDSVPDSVPAPASKSVPTSAPPAPWSSASEPAASSPPAATPALPGRIALPSLGQIIPESAKAEARAAKRAREGNGAGAAETTSTAEGAAPAPAMPHEPAWAISTRPLRTRTEAEQVMAAMDGLLKTLGTPAVRTEILPEGDDWRVVGWPYTDRREADRALAVLVARGMRVQVIGF